MLLSGGAAGWLREQRRCAHPQPVAVAGESTADGGASSGFRSRFSQLLVHGRFKSRTMRQRQQLYGIVHVHCLCIALSPCTRPVRWHWRAWPDACEVRINSVMIHINETLRFTPSIHPHVLQRTNAHPFTTNTYTWTYGASTWFLLTPFFPTPHE